MKKFMLLAIVAMFAIINVFAENEVVNNETTTTISSEDNVCVEVGNVTASFDGSYVEAQNYNDYRVSVNWTLYAIHINSGERVVFDSGSMSLGPYGDSCNTDDDSKLVKKSDNYEAYSLEIKVYKCD